MKKYTYYYYCPTCGKKRMKNPRCKMCANCFGRNEPEINCFKCRIPLKLKEAEEAGVYYWRIKKMKKIYLCKECERVI
jgi:hypothetical protein